MSTEELKKLWETNEILINEEYQRSFVWKPKQKRALIDSISKGYSIGVIVIWKTKKDQLEVLDGQQRIRTIIEYLSNQFPNNEGKKFSELRITEQSEIKGYSVYYLELKSHLTEAEVSDIFTRLQEGTPLNVAEKVNAFHGAFRDSFIRLFNDVTALFSKIRNYRFRGRLLAAQFLLLELETDFEKLIFPNLSYLQFKNVSENHRKNVNAEKFNRCRSIVQFLANSLGNQLIGIPIRDLISLYILASYLHKEQADISALAADFQQFASEFMDNIKMFSIYDVAPPQGMEPYLFDKYKEYKEHGRKATVGKSIEHRFWFALEEYRRLYPGTKFKTDPDKLSPQSSQKSPYELLKEFEGKFRAFIEYRLSLDDDNWWKSKIPQDIREKAEGRKKDNETVFPWHNRPNLHPLHYVNFAEYSVIIEKRDNWDAIFKPIFKDQPVIKAKLKELDHIRNDIAHTRELTLTQEQMLPRLLKEVESYFTVGTN